MLQKSHVHKWQHKHKHSKEHGGEADSTPGSPKGIMRLFSKSKKFATDSAHGPDDQANVDLAAALNRKFSRHDAARTAATASEEPALAADQHGDESGIMLTGSEAYSDAPEAPPGVPGANPQAPSPQAQGHKGRRLTKLKPKEGMLHHDVALMWWQHAQKRHQFVKRAVGRSSAPQGEEAEGDAGPAEDHDVEVQQLEHLLVFIADPASFIVHIHCRRRLIICLCSSQTLPALSFVWIARLASSIEVVYVADAAWFFVCIH